LFDLAWPARGYHQALERRFQPVNVPEPTNEETLTILQGLAKKYEEISLKKWEAFGEVGML